MLQSLLAWIGNHGALATWLGIFSAILFIISLLSLPWLVSLIPEDYFTHKQREPSKWKTLHPLTRIVLLALKNLLGLVLLAGGIFMLVFPGQGLLTILMGLFLVDYPGKYQLERRIATSPRVLSSINWLRAKRGKPPLIAE